MEKINKLIQKRVVIISIVVAILLATILAFYATLKQHPTSTKKSESPVSTSTEPAVKYSPEGNTKMLKILEERPPLSQRDKEIRARLVTMSSPLDKTYEYSIEYIPTPDQFQVEIFTVDLTQAKTDATDWFLKKGLSKEAVCNLPLTFYLNFNVAESMRNLKAEFNPLPEGC